MTAAALGFRSPHDGEWRQITPGERARFHASSAQTMGAFAIIELMVEPGNGVPMHVHGKEDEHFIVLEGKLQMAVGARRLDVVTGESITVGMGVAHAWCNASKAPVHMLAVFSPGGIEKMFRELEGVDPAEIEAIANRYGTRLIGPPLRETAYSINAPRR
jgi:mannose-6-phosphate isomerase-like protein (cupin superfamily)